jgi:hypothetical protein
MSIEENLHKVLRYLYDHQGSQDVELICIAAKLSKEEIRHVIGVHATGQNPYLTGSDTALAITANGRNYFEAIPKTQEKENLEMQKLRTEVQVLVDTLADYPNVKRKANWSFNIAIISLITTVIATIIAWIVAAR